MTKRQRRCLARRAARASARATLLTLALLLTAAATDGARAADLDLTYTSGDACFDLAREAPGTTDGSDAAKEKRAASDPAAAKRADKASAGDEDIAEDESAEKTDAAAAPKAAQGGGDEFHRWGVGVHAGVSIPHPDFSDSFGPGPSFGVDLEYRFNKYFSLEGIYNYNRFGGETVGPFGPGNVFFELDGTDIHQLSLNGKVYAAAGNSPFRPFFNFGGGAYVFDTSTTRGGINVGGGIQFDVTETISVEGGYNFHNIFTSGSSVRYSALQGGVRFRF